MGGRQCYYPKILVDNAAVFVFKQGTSWLMLCGGVSTPFKKISGGVRECSKANTIQLFCDNPALWSEREWVLRMKNLFLIDGAAGTGKTDMLEYLSEKYSTRNCIAIIRKYTTRKLRLEEISRNLNLDLEFVTTRQFAAKKKEDRFYCYTYGGESYGFPKFELDRVLRSHQNVFIIVRDRATIQQLISDYPRICTIPVFIYTDREETVKRMRADMYNQEEIDFRSQRTDLAWDDYLKHSDLYREVIINNSNKTDFRRLIDYLVKKYAPENEAQDALIVSNSEKFQIITSLIGFKKTIQNHLVDYERNVFMMMKFRETNRIVYDFIKTELERNGMKCVRADFPEWKITNNVYNPLAVLYCCKYGIALFDEPEEGNVFSPNVAYELSMMQSHGKDCLILRHKTLPEMPFDLIKDIHQTYSKDLELKKIVNDWVTAIRSSTSE